MHKASWVVAVVHYTGVVDVAPDLCAVLIRHVALQAGARRLELVHLENAPRAVAGVASDWLVDCRGSNDDDLVIFE